VGLDEPLGPEFACSGRFASHCLERGIWAEDAARFAIDLWLRTEAVANHFALGQIWRPASTSASATTLREAVRQIFMSLVASCRAHASYWRSANSVTTLRTWGAEPDGLPAAADWDYASLAQQARHDIAAIAPLLEAVLDPAIFPRLLDDIAVADSPPEDELWVRIVYAFLAATTRGPASIEQLADMFVPIYMWRAARFMSQTALEPADVVQTRLNVLGDAFQRLKPVLVRSWDEA
jgi:hypothetical protein